jgi:hypothetical protein
VCFKILYKTNRIQTNIGFKYINIGRVQFYNKEKSRLHPWELDGTNGMPYKIVNNYIERFFPKNIINQ